MKISNSNNKSKATFIFRKLWKKIQFKLVFVPDIGEARESLCS